MRRVKKDFHFSTVKITHFETGEILQEFKVDGKIDKSTVARRYFKKNKYLPIKIEVQDLKETYVMSGEDFMEHGEKFTFANQG